ncbi:unnamed protein product [Pedinophyceae sp. YPF-701]|nr:unnamed protein product [Pedinophyceae sp. YPF-701]
MAFELEKPPYPLDALEPHMSKLTLEYHWGKHHQTYVTNMNNQLKDNAELMGKSLVEIIMASWNGGKQTPVFNNAAQVWNHDFFWKCMRPGGGGAPSGELAAAIDKAFGSLSQFKSEFKNAGATQFGSGWAWLVVEKDSKKLAIKKTPNAENPMCDGHTPILTMDVWEHAYYLDQQNKRPAYMDIFLENLVNWDFVAAQYAEAMK